MVDVSCKDDGPYADSAIVLADGPYADSAIVLATTLALGSVWIPFSSIRDVGVVNLSRPVFSLHWLAAKHGLDQPINHGRIGCCNMWLFDGCGLLEGRYGTGRMRRPAVFEVVGADATRLATSVS